MGRSVKVRKSKCQAELRQRSQSGRYMAMLRLRCHTELLKEERTAEAIEVLCKECLNSYRQDYRSWCCRTVGHKLMIKWYWLSIKEDINDKSLHLEPSASLYGQDKWVQHHGEGWQQLQGWQRKGQNVHYWLFLCNWSRGCGKSGLSIMIS